MSIVEIRKLVIGYFKSKGTTGSRIRIMPDNQVYAIYKKHQLEIEWYLEYQRDLKELGEFYSSAGDGLITERDHWSDKEWEDYAYEEAN